MDELDKQLRAPDQPLVTQNYRFLGFINDVGEALHSFLPKPVYVGTYVITGVYALAAVYYDNRLLADQLDAAGVKDAAERRARLQSRTMDNAAWHLLATVAITPLVVIPAVKVGAKRLLASRTSLSAPMREKVLPAAVAIAAIPAVVSPVDNAVTWAFNQVRAKPEPYHWAGYWSSLNEHHEDGAHGEQLK